jgi:carbohydrate-selective porin OprB
MFILFYVLLLSATAMPPAFGQSSAPADGPPPAVVKPAESAESPAKANWLTRSTLTGDWGGARSSLADEGVTFDLRYTSTYQGLASGTGDKDYEYGGKVDAFVNLDSTKMGLWKGGGLRTHLEYSNGNAPSNLGGDRRNRRQGTVLRTSPRRFRAGRVPLQSE